jgi:hypothetical protein
VVVPVVAVRTDLIGRVRAVVDHRGLTGLGIVDAFTVVYGLALTLIYLPRLPIHAAITVRYLLPLYPIGIYALARQPAVRRVIDERFLPLSFAYAGSLLVGGQLLVLYLWATAATRGEAVQTHGALWHFAFVGPQALPFV